MLRERKIIVIIICWEIGIMLDGVVIWYVVNGFYYYYFIFIVYSRERRVCVWDYMNKYKIEAKVNNLES